MDLDCGADNRMSEFINGGFWLAAAGTRLELGWVFPGRLLSLALHNDKFSPAS
jgi:hypothetical protein